MNIYRTTSGKSYKIISNSDIRLKEIGLVPGETINILQHNDIGIIITLHGACYYIAPNGHITVKEI